MGDKAPEFFDPPSCPFYQYALGSFTPYGDAAFHLLQFLAENDGQFDPVKYSAKALQFFDGEYKGRLNHSWKEFVKNVKENGKQWPHCGAEDSQADGLTKAGIVAGILHGHPDLLTKTDEAVRVIQNTDKAAAMALAGVRIIEFVLAGKSTSEAVKETARVLKEHNSSDELAQHIENLTSKVDQPHRDVVKAIGLSCGYPNSFVNICHLLLNDNLDYATAVRQTLLAGGDNASRALFLGAVLGAKYGVQGIPQSWRDKTTHYTQALQFATKALHKL